MTTLTMDNPINYSTLSGVFAPASYAINWNKNLPRAYAIPSRSFFSDAEDALIFLESHNVVIEESPSVESFLANNSGIVAHLYDIPKKVSDYFGDISTKFGVFSDPDNPEDRAEFFIEVETDLSPQKANDVLSKINKEWLLKSHDADLEFFNITLKFI